MCECGYECVCIRVRAYVCVCVCCVCVFEEMILLNSTAMDCPCIDACLATKQLNLLPLTG